MSTHALGDQTHRHAPPAWRFGRRWRIALLVLLALAGLVWAFTGRRVPQSPGYHDFADKRVIGGLRNGVNVLTNAGFALAGALGLLRLRRSPATGRPAWVVFFVAVGLTSLGSAWYHLDPSNERLVWDRLPMAIAFMSLFSALVAERIDRRAGAALLVPLVAAGVASVAWWAITERAGAGDLKPYLLVQFYPLVAVPLVLALFPAPGSRTWPYLVAVAAYVAAKLVEVEDEAVFHALGVVSGHGLKHVLAAVAVGALAWAPGTTRPPARRREGGPPAPATGGPAPRPTP